MTPEEKIQKIREYFIYDILSEEDRKALQQSGYRNQVLIDLYDKLSEQSVLVEYEKKLKEQQVVQLEQSVAEKSASQDLKGAVQNPENASIGLSSSAPQDLGNAQQDTGSVLQTGSAGSAPQDSKSVLTEVVQMSVK